METKAKYDTMDALVRAELLKEADARNNNPCFEERSSEFNRVYEKNMISTKTIKDS